MKEDISAISFSLNLTYLIVNILFLLIPEYDFKLILIVETFFIPFIYLILLVIRFLVEKDII